MWRTSFIFEVPGGKGCSAAPRKKVTLTYFAKQWMPRNQPWPSTPYSGEFHLTALCTPGTARTISASSRWPSARFQPGMAAM